MSWRSSPHKRTWEALEPFRREFEVTPRAPGKAAIWRLTYTAKKRLGLNYRDVNPLSQKADHWLVLGDLWIDMTQAGGRPSQWVSEKASIGRFDVFAVWQDVPFLFEVQKSPLSPRRWAQKWEQRFKWYREHYKGPGPYLVCIDFSNTMSSREGIRLFKNGTQFCTAVNQAIAKRSREMG
ncbi:hypothetical protein LLE49_07255 [Alicyclobacillus tolerans]|uniref:hypothetical protein n=1 Tax=Alicyclobacillus tolerans TaxID=90970 RepID=UPI001F21BD2A|nr:hypothetical protein [Alicyclobacillus tolerans]MCF8564541.1 hypothetical protein [Alicyclobacillus tolerans]